MLYAVQENAWVDEKTFLKWINKVWKPFCINKSSTYLLMDECTVHLRSTCLQEIQNCSTEVDFIIGGYTSQLQILDVGINAPFKSYVKAGYETWMATNIGGKVTRVDVANWISSAWDTISKESIVYTWNSIGIRLDIDTIQ